jgi:hypothetical protein
MQLLQRSDVARITTHPLHWMHSDNSFSVSVVGRFSSNLNVSRASIKLKVIELLTRSRLGS